MGYVKVTEKNQPPKVMMEAFGQLLQDSYQDKTDVKIP